jgi:hypothetical protein
MKGTLDPDLVPVYKDLISIMKTGANNMLDEKANYFSTQRLRHIVEDPEVRKELIYPKQLLQETAKPINQSNDITKEKIITVRGPSGQIGEMSEENAKLYLAKPGYTRVK